MDIQGYVNEISALRASGQSTEHSFRPALARLFAAIDPALTVINEPKHLTDVGAPDFVFNRGEVAIGWCEAKDIGKDIRKFAVNDYSKEQKERYKKGLPNLIYTNGLDFEFIRDGESVAFITIADLNPTLPARTENFPALETRLRDFASVTPLSITSSKRLAEIMAGKAAIIKDIMGRALVMDMEVRDAGAPPTDLIGQYETFKASLIHDITVPDFADIYAETIAYGLFAARLHDETPDTFTRTEALDLLPKSNPFLRELFVYIAGPNLDDRLKRVIDELCDVFRATDMAKVLRHFGKITARQDPFLHFYENFLAEYNPAKRKARGVWYTPEPVVNFIVRAVDEVLKTEFGLADGLADTSKITIDWDTGQNGKDGKPATIKKEVHRVQILDPATGTGTFLAEVLRLISEHVKSIAPGHLSAHIEQEVIPRIHGFELLMASYAMCHMKLDMILTRLGYKPSANPPRLGVYLTNSLDGGERVEQTLPFMGLQRAIAEEAKQANNIKRQTPIMCVIGNPPYSGISQNNGKWITDKIEDYKYVDGVHFGERKHWLQDDYVKFIRFAEHMIEQNGEGVLGFITNHGYLDNPTFRGMRWHLMQTFDRIHVLDLHGNAKKLSHGPDGKPDKNIFDIQQGVAVIIGVKKRDQKQLHKKTSATVWHQDLWGSREDKYDRLWTLDLADEASSEVKLREPYFAFGAESGIGAEQYMLGFSLTNLFGSGTMGVQTSRDSLALDFDRESQAEKVADFVDERFSDAEIVRRFFPGKKFGKYPAGDSRGWKLSDARLNLRDAGPAQNIVPILYRPFDVRWITYTPLMVDWPRENVMRQLLKHENLTLLFPRQLAGEVYSHISLTDRIAEMCAISNKTKEQNAVFPLYLYPEEGTLDQTIRTNFEPKLYAQIRKAAGLIGTPAAPDGTDAFRRATGDARPDEVKVFDYIYGVLHCPAYRTTYAEFLKIDFPRIPFPASPESFAKISAQGEALRRLHLMEDAAIGATPYPFDGEGDSVVDKPRYEGGRVYINGVGSNGQYFDAVPAVAWDFPIGGYRPAQKWLKDRKGRALSWDDIRHYQKIIKILTETDSIMREIELPISEAD